MPTIRAISFLGHSLCSKAKICDLCDHEGQGVIGRATLDKNGDIKWKEELPCFQYSINKENVVCNSCRHLPMCYGPCPAQRNSLLGSFQECPYENIDETIERNCELHCNASIIYLIYETKTIFLLPAALE